MGGNGTEHPISIGIFLFRKLGLGEYTKNLSVSNLDWNIEEKECKSWNTTLPIVTTG